MKNKTIILEDFHELNKLNKKGNVKFRVIEEYKRNGFATWMTKYSKSITTCSMDDNHLINSYNLMKRYRNKTSSHYAWIYVLSWELAKRGIDVNKEK